MACIEGFVTFNKIGTYLQKISLVLKNFRQPKLGNESNQLSSAERVYFVRMATVV